MLPLLRPLLALILGIVLSPFLDACAVWVCLPLAVILSAARSWVLPLVFVLFGAGLRSLEPPVPPVPGDVPVRIVGHLRRPPEWRGLGAYLDVDIKLVDDRPYRGRARLTEFLDDPELRRMFDELQLGSGDRLEILVKLHRPVVYRNPGVFDMRRYLERQQIYWTGNIRNPRLITVQQRGWHGFDHAKSWIFRRVAEPFDSDPEVQGLVLGMVLGRRYNIGGAVERQFQAAGLYHLVVVSGFNLAIIAAVISWIARRLPIGRRTRLGLVLVACLAYAAVVEGQAPVARAALMVGFHIVGRLLDRGKTIGNTVAGTALILLVIDPTAIEDSSFQMTFAAVGAIVGIGVPAVKWAFGPLNEALAGFNDSHLDARLSARVAAWRVARRMWCELRGLPTWIVILPWRLLSVAGELAAISCCVGMVFTMFMVESFHRISPYSAALNVPAAIVAAAVTPLGLALIVLPDPITRPVAGIISALLHFLLRLLDIAMELPGAAVRVPSAPVCYWVLYVLTIVLFAWAVRRRRVWGLITSSAALLALHVVVVKMDFPRNPPTDVTVTFLDVGQGDSTLIEFPDGKTMLIDGGGVSAGRFTNLRDEATFSIGENVVSPFLFHKRFRRIETLVLTHAHYDHIDGLLDVIQNFEVGELWLGRNPMVPAYRELLQRAMEKAIPLRWLAAGDRIVRSSQTFRVLHPLPNWRVRKTAQNDDSLVLLMESSSQTTMLLTGDIERSINAPKRVDVLKVSHHGSRGVRLRVDASIRVVSVGANNPFGHPHASALPALRTDQRGAIAILLGRRPVVLER